MISRINEGAVERVESIRHHLSSDVGQVKSVSLVLSKARLVRRSTVEVPPSTEEDSRRIHYVCRMMAGHIQHSSGIWYELKDRLVDRVGDVKIVLLYTVARMVSQAL